MVIGIICAVIVFVILACFLFYRKDVRGIDQEWEEMIASLDKVKKDLENSININSAYTSKLDKYAFTKPEPSVPDYSAKCACGHKALAHNHKGCSVLAGRSGDTCACNIGSKEVMEWAKQYGDSKESTLAKTQADLLRLKTENTNLRHENAKLKDQATPQDSVKSFDG